MKPQIFKVLTQKRAEDIQLLLMQRQPKDNEQFPTAYGFRLSWDKYLRKRAQETVIAIDELLMKFRIIRRALKRDPAAIRKKSPGRPRREENYWLAKQLADILETMPGFKVGASKNRPTLFMQVLRIWFAAVGQTASIDRIAKEAVESLREPTYLK